MPDAVLTDEEFAELALDYEGDQPTDCDQAVVQHVDLGATLQALDAAAMAADFVILTRQAQANLHGNNHWIVENKFGKGMRTELHEQNPVVLFEHGFGGVPFPIGKAETPDRNYTVKRSARQATARLFFSQSLPEGAAVFALVDEGILRMSSIGFRGLKGMAIKQQRRESLAEGVESLTNWRGIDFVETLLLEISIVSNGADQGALKQVLDRGTIAGEKIAQTIRPALEQAAGPQKVWSPGADFAKLSLADIGLTVEGPAEMVERVYQSFQEFTERQEAEPRPQATGFLAQHARQLAAAEQPSDLQQFGTPALEAFVRNDIAQSQVQPPVDPPAPPATTIPVIDQSITGEQLAAAYRQQFPQGPDDAGIVVQYLADHAVAEVRAALDAVAGGTRELTQELERRQGKVA